MISRQRILKEQVPTQSQNLAVRSRAGEIIVGHQVAVIVVGAGEPIIFQRRVPAADMKILSLRAVVDETITHREITAIDVNVMRGRGQRSRRIPIGAELAELDGGLA